MIKKEYSFTVEYEDDEFEFLEKFKQADEIFKLAFVASYKALIKQYINVLKQWGDFTNQGFGYNTGGIVSEPNIKGILR